MINKNNKKNNNKNNNDIIIIIISLNTNDRDNVLISFYLQNRGFHRNTIIIITKMITIISI